MKSVVQKELKRDKLTFYGRFVGALIVSTQHSSMLGILHKTTQRVSRDVLQGQFLTLKRLSSVKIANFYSEFINTMLIIG
jgi:hypothetical protein